jgi:oxygen-independent coproporphyrinogen-3 oxidase
MRLYVHWPFCASRCSYCDFNSRVAGAGLRLRYREALLREAKMKSERLGREHRKIASIYFGGGTPSLMAGSELAAILADLMGYYDIQPGAEITVEVNPGDWGREDFERARAGGVNRFSIGFQSSDDRILKLLGRRHGAEEALMSLRLALATGARVSADLLCGLPRGSRLSTARSLARVLGLEPHHISLYCLTLEAGVRLAEWVNQGRISLPEDDQVAEEYLALAGMLRRAGYEQYEVSNFSRPGCESSHNRAYWSREEYLGFGAGAHSLFADTRFSNKRSVLAYIEGVGKGELPIAEMETLDESEKLREELMLGLRTSAGVREGILTEAAAGDLAELGRLGLLKRQAGRISLTPAGLMLSNAIIAQLMPYSSCA